MGFVTSFFRTEGFNGFVFRASEKAGINLAGDSLFFFKVPESQSSPVILTKSGNSIRILYIHFREIQVEKYTFLPKKNRITNGNQKEDFQTTNEIFS